MKQQVSLSSTSDSTREDSGSCNGMAFKLFMSEFIGTFLFVYLGQASISSFLLIGTQNDILNRQLASVLTGYGLSFLLATLLTLNLSNSHLNPAYTLASALFRYLSWSNCLKYLLAQYSGAFLAAIFLHATFSDKLTQRHIEGLLIGSNVTQRAHGNILSTGKLFSSFPPNEISLTQLFISYTLATSFLALLLLAIHESKLIRIPRSSKPFYLSLALISIQASFAANGGPVLNPAQDFAPRLYISLFGWGSAAFNPYNYHYWWFCGIAAPHLGAAIGFGLYQVLAHLNSIQDSSQVQQQQPLNAYINKQGSINHHHRNHGLDRSETDFPLTGDIYN